MTQVSCNMVNNMLQSCNAIAETSWWGSKANRSGTRYVPHQGKRECERRLRRMARKI
jgi:hypothetical protein